MKTRWIVVSLFVLLPLYSCSSIYPVGITPTDSRSVIEEGQTGGANERIIVFKVTGKGVAPENATNKGEAVILGERAAVLDGYRQLAEKLKGVLIEAYSQRKGAKIDMDKIEAQTISYLKGVKIMDIVQGEYEIYKASMQVRVFFFESDLIWWPSGIGNSVLPYGAHYRSGFLARNFPTYFATPAMSSTTRCSSYPWCRGNYYYSPNNAYK